MKSIAKSSLFYTIYTILNIVCPLITSAYISRILLPDGVGKVAYAQAISSYFVLIATFGINEYGLREIAKVRDDKEDKNILFSELFIFNFLTTSMSLISYLLLVFCVKGYRDDIFLYLASGLLIAFNFLNIDWLYQGEEEYEYIVIRSIIIKALSIASIFIFIHNTSDYIKYAAVMSIALGGNYIFNIINARKYVKFTFKGIQISKHFKPLTVIAATAIISNIYAKIDITMLGFFTTDDRIGIYSYGQKIIELLIMLCTSITVVFMPRLSYYYENNKEEFYNLIYKGIKVLSFISFPIVAGIFIEAHLVVRIMFGEAFIESARVIRFLCGMILIRGFGNFICYQLTMCTRNEKERLVATIMGSVTNIVFNFLLIPQYYEIGAVCASIIGELVVNGYLYVVIKNKLHIKIDVKNIVEAIIATFIMSIVCIVLLRLKLNDYYAILLITGVGVIVYCAVNIVIKNEALFMVINLIKRRINK